MNLVGDQQTTTQAKNTAKAEPMCAPGCTHPQANLSTGAVSATLHGDHLIDIRINGIPAAERLYPTVRGIRWQTSTLEHSRSDVRSLDGGFVVHVASVHRIDDARIRCDLQLLGTDDTIDVAATFTTITQFASRRLGLCLILPPTLTGSSVRATTRAGLPVSTVLPRSIAPWPILTATEVAIQINRRSTLHVATPEDEFEMEDHRNWGDPGWKMYTPALNDDAPRRSSAATAFTRRLTIRATTTAQHRQEQRLRQTRAARVRIGAPTERQLPALGTAARTGLPGAALKGLHRLRLRHLYFEWDPRSAISLDSVAAEASTLGARLALAVTTQSAAPDWHAVAMRLMPHRHLLERIHVLDVETLTTTPGAPTAARRALRQVGITVPIGGGSAVCLANVNRTRYAVGDLDYVAYGLTPQTHHRDEQHILSTIQVQRDLARQARLAANTHNVAVMPITWQRENDTEPDHRLRQPLAAVWFLGILSRLIGTTNVTLLDTHQISAQSTPLTCLLTTIGRHSQGRLRLTHTASRALVALAFDTITLVGNASNEQQAVTLELPHVPPRHLRLDPHEIHYALHEAHHGDQ